MERRAQCRLALHARPGNPAQRLGNRGEPRLRAELLSAGDPVDAIGQNDRDQVAWLVRRHRPQGAGAHQQLAVTQQGNDEPVGNRFGDTHRGRKRRAHGAAEIEVRAVVGCRPKRRGGGAQR